MKLTVKKLLAAGLAAVLAGSLLASCGQTAAIGTEETTESEDVKEETAEEAETSAETETAKETEISSAEDTDLSQNSGSMVFSKGPSNLNLGSAETKLTGFSTGAEKAALKGNTVNNVSYIMIYNPAIFDELSDDYYGTSKTTGSIGSEIMVGINRAGGLSDDIEVPDVISAWDIDREFSDEDADYESGRSGYMGTLEYAVGDTESFYVDDESIMTRELKKLTCMYAGDNCYVFAENGLISEADAEKYGAEFDDRIYDLDTEAFGQGRFTDDGGKVFIIFQPIRDGIAGFFSKKDIYASGEYSSSMAKTYGLNLDKAIIHLNSNMLETNEKLLLSTLAHEYQHQICATDKFSYVDTPFMRTWLNESMSAYAEELAFPGIKEEGYYNELYYVSDYFRKGQSLYNFYNEGDEYIGAYGAVYLYEEFIRLLAGDEVFGKIHENWREACSADISEAEALYLAFPEKLRDYISDAITYPDAVEDDFETEYEEWMSKLSLLFYMETMSMNLANLNGYEDQVHEKMLYSDMDEVLIEGGGKILVATDDGSFTIPDDADEGLIYICYDEDFNIVLDFCR